MTFLVADIIFMRLLPLDILSYNITVSSSMVLKYPTVLSTLQRPMLQTLKVRGGGVK